METHIKHRRKAVSRSTGLCGLKERAEHLIIGIASHQAQHLSTVALVNFMALVWLLITAICI